MRLERFLRSRRHKKRLRDQLDRLDSKDPIDRELRPRIERLLTKILGDWMTLTENKVNIQRDIPDP